MRSSVGPRGEEQGNGRGRREEAGFFEASLERAAGCRRRVQAAWIANDAGRARVIGMSWESLEAGAGRSAALSDVPYEEVIEI